MHESTAQRFGELSDKEKELMKGKVGNDTAHIISGTVEGHGATEIASAQAKLDAKVIKLERTASGGIDYQLAIFVDEPEPVVAEVLKPAAPEQTDEEKAIEYFTQHGMPAASAKAQVARFGTARVLAMREKELDEQLKSLLNKTPEPTKAAAAQPPDPNKV